MIEVTQTVLIDLPADQCWEKLQDYTAAKHYVPDVTDAKIISEPQTGIGAHRQVFFKSQASAMDETIIDWQEGRSFTLRTHRGDGRAIPIFDELHFRYEIESKGPAQTAFKPAMLIKPRLGFGLLSKTLVKKRLSQTLHAIGLSMKEYYETGEPVPLTRRNDIAGASES